MEKKSFFVHIPNSRDSFYKHNGIKGKKKTKKHISQPKVPYRPFRDTCFAKCANVFVNSYLHNIEKINSNKKKIIPHNPDHLRFRFRKHDIKMSNPTKTTNQNLFYNTTDVNSMVYRVSQSLYGISLYSKTNRFQKDEKTCTTPANVGPGTYHKEPSKSPTKPIRTIILPKSKQQYRAKQYTCTEESQDVGCEQPMENSTLKFSHSITPGVPFNKSPRVTWVDQESTYYIPKKMIDANILLPEYIAGEKL